MQQDAYFSIQQLIISHNVMLHYLRFLQGFAEVPIGLKKELNQFIKKVNNHKVNWTGGACSQKGKSW